MILLLSDDLLDASKTITPGRAVGVPVTQCKSVEAIISQFEKHRVPCCIIDLQFPGLDLLALSASVVGRFGEALSHRLWFPRRQATARGRTRGRIQRSDGPQPVFPCRQ